MPRSREKSITIHKQVIDKSEDTEYISSHFRGDVMDDGTVLKDVKIKVRHKYCNQDRMVELRSIKKGRKCSKCCGSYEKSFAYHIEVELGEPLDKYWDFEKNTVNPYHIGKYYGDKTHNKKVWIKCQEKDYHGSYEITTHNFVNSRRCPYCNSKKIHIKDSFAQYHIDNTDKDFLEKYWDYDKNILDPWETGKCSTYEVYLICQEDSSHESYGIRCHHFTEGRRCRHCITSRGESKIQKYLNSVQINYSYDKEYFNDLLSIHGNPLRPDFILPNEKIWIEYDGEFHYEDRFKDGSFERQIRNDRIKDKYAKENGWKMIRIPYWEFDNIEKILENELIYTVDLS